MKLFAEPVVRATGLFPEGFELLTTGIGFDGAIFCVARQPNERQTEQGGVRDLHVKRWDDGTVRSATISKPPLTPDYVQPLGDGFLLASARCSHDESGAERNALVCRETGQLRASMTLGDGILDVRTTSEDQIWVSYFDEGVLGNCGWGSPGPAPIGAPGIVRFDRNGRIEFRYDAEAAGTDMICDAYAMNVDEHGTVWTCFYTEFPIVRIRDGTYQRWEYGRAGASALAVKGQRALMVGDYKRRNALTLVELGSDGRARPTDGGKLLTAEGKSLDHARFVGVGSTLYATQDGVVFQLAEW